MNRNTLMLTVAMVASSAFAVVGGHILHTAQGALRGAVTEDGARVSYRGIPYASGAAGHRFRRAAAAPAWTGVRDATEEAESCPSAAGGSALGREDCLTLDVHAPAAASAPRAVMVWLPPGRSPPEGRSSDPRLLVERGVIVVVVGYRVGALGFLCLGSDATPGNGGAKDVLLALRWVRDNIVAFGGDSARVTLAGSGFGAAVAEALVLSPTSEGLLHRAILQSGTALGPWAYNYDAADRAEALAKHFTESTDVEEMAAALLEVEAERLVLMTRRLDFAYFPFALCSEKEFENEERLLGSHPIDILTSKKFKRVPMLIGSNSNEADILAPTLMRANALNKAKKDLSILLPDELRFVSGREIEQATERIRKAYFPAGNLTTETLLEYCTDVYFSCHVSRSVRLHAAASELPVYHYEFRSGRRGGGRRAGAAHADELSYLFPSGPWGGDDEDRELEEQVTALWANFVEHGNPTPAVSPLLPTTWEAVRGTAPRLYALGGGAGVTPHMTSEPHGARRRLWQELYDHYYYRRRSL